MLWPIFSFATTSQRIQMTISGLRISIISQKFFSNWFFSVRGLKKFIFKSVGTDRLKFKLLEKVRCRFIEKVTWKKKLQFSTPLPPPPLLLLFPSSKQGATGYIFGAMGAGQRVAKKIFANAQDKLSWMHSDCEPWYANCSKMNSKDKVIVVKIR